MVIAAVVVGVAAVATSVSSSISAGKAAKAQENAAETQIQLAQNEFNVEQANEQPYLTAGNNALQQLATGSAPGGFIANNFTAADFTHSAGYTSSLQAGTDAINAQAAARGQRLSPATLGALGQYTANASLQDFNTAYSQFQQQKGIQIGALEDVAGLGAQAVAGTNAAEQNSTGQQISATGAIGNAQAANDIAQGNSINGAINGVAGAAAGYNSDLYQQQYINNLFGSPGSSATAGSPGLYAYNPNAGTTTTSDGYVVQNGSNIPQNPPN